MNRKPTYHQIAGESECLDISILTNHELKVREASLIAVLSSINPSLVTVVVTDRQAVEQVFDCISQRGAIAVYLDKDMKPSRNGHIGIIHQQASDESLGASCTKIRLRQSEVDVTMTACLVKEHSALFEISLPWGTVELPLSDIGPFICQFMNLLTALYDDNQECFPQQAISTFLLDIQRQAMSNVAHAPSNLSVYTQFESYLEELERSNHDLFNIKECIAFPLFVVDKNLCVTQANRGCRSIIKDDLSIVGKYIHELSWLIVIPAIDKMIHRVIISGRSEQTLLQNTQIEHVYVLRVMPYHSQGEQVRGAILVFDEVTEQWQAESSLRASEQRFRQVTEALPQLILELSCQGSCDFVNTQWSSYTGMTLSSQTSMCWLDCIEAEDRPLLQEQWDDDHISGQSVSVECRVLHHDGTSRWFSALFVPIFNEYGGLAKWFACFTDIEEFKQTQLNLQRSQNRVSNIIDTMPEAILVVDQQGIIRVVNKRIEDIFGYEMREVKGQAVEMLLPERYRSGHGQLRAGYMKKPETMLLGAGRDLYALHKDGSEFPVELGLAPLEEEGNIYTVVSVANISQRKDADVELNLAAKVFSSTMDGIFILDTEQKVIKVNSAAQQIFGFPEQEWIGQPLTRIRSDRHSNLFYDKLWRAARINGRWQGEIWQCHKNGSDIPMWLSLTAVFNTHGDIERYIATMYDISEQVKAKEYIYHLAHYDMLTQLPNRTLFLEKFHEYTQSPTEQTITMALLFVDLDNFKQVNDTLGHPVGDILLCQAAERMRSVIRDQDVVSRHSGDEFTILLRGVDDKNLISDIAHRLCVELANPFDLGRGDFFVSASIGIARYPTDGTDVNTLLRHADLAMYRAKYLGRNQYRFYQPEMSSVLVELTELQSDLRLAIERDELVLHYQPIIDIQSERCVGVEALTRWWHPTKGFISPVKFIPAAEDSNLILPLGEWVLRAACRQLHQWNQSGVCLDFISINVSGKQIMQMDFAALLRQVLDEYQLEAKQVLIELTESFVMHESDIAINRLMDIRQIGVGIAIDDFGTGYSSLSYLKQLPVTKLKLDRSFVNDLPNDINDVEISRAIFHLGDAVGLQVVAEGVETYSQHQFLVDERYHLCQGFYYARPMLADDINEFWRNYSFPHK